MKYGFLKVAIAAPKIRVADPAFNAEALCRVANEAAADGVRVLVFPELSLTGCTCGDLFRSDRLLCGAREALKSYLQRTATLPLVSLVGLPLSHGNATYNCVAVCHEGQLLGLIPEACPSSRDALEHARYFSAYEKCGAPDAVLFDGTRVPFGTELRFACREFPALVLAAEVGEAAGAHSPLSERLVAAGATLICNPTASPELVGAANARRTVLQAQASRLCTAYLSQSAGAGESTTDLVLGGHGMILEGASILAEKAPFSSDEWVATEVDLERLLHDRRVKAFPAVNPCENPEIAFSLPVEETKLTRTVEASPFVPADADELARRCETILAIQVAGLCQRVERAFAQKLVLGISGGLDSTLALLVMARAMDALGRPRTDILAVTMPCFGTTSRTKNNATVLCEELGVDFRCVDIFDAVNQHFRDIGHDPENRNVVYENCQARERTQILMDIANACGGMVIGTGDLSELALGWATYNGDQMSMYGVNADVPKTLVRHIVAHCARVATEAGETALGAALLDVVNTPVSPELLPADENGEIAQRTEDLVGPYEIHDFYLYYLLRYGFSPAKLYRLASYALGDRYDDETLRKWLKTFVRRFFSQQFKRSCMPDGPKVGSVGLSPRGDWQMPSDASSALWLAEAEAL